MKLTVIPSDNFMKLDGVALHFQFDAPTNVHAIQWNGVEGSIEYLHGKADILKASELSVLTPYINAFNAEVSRLAALELIPINPDVEAANLALAALKGELQAIKVLPLIKQFRKKTRAEVVDMVQAAFPAGPQRDLVKVLALVAWSSTLQRDPNDD